MTKNYDYDVQKLYLEMMLADAETFVRCQGIFDYTLFDRKLQEVAQFINEYSKQYSVLPDYDIVNATTKSNLVKPSEIKSGHLDWLMDDFEQFTRHKSLEKAIIESSDLLDKHDYGAVEKLIKDAVQIGLAKDMGTDYFENPRARLMRIKDKNGQVSSGWASLDRSLYGGINRGELNIFAGGSGSGKSLFLANLSVNWALDGLNVLYVTFELSEELVSMRIDSMVTGINSREIFKSIDDVELKVRMIGKKSGKLQVKYMPPGKTVNDLRAYMKEYEIKTGDKIDILVVDYLDLMFPLSKKISPADLFIKDKYVSEELRALAVEKNVVLATASQLNRGSVDEVEFDHSHISGGISKIQTADNVFGIFTSKAMKERGQYQLQLMKTRSSSGVGQKIDLEFNIETLRITDQDQEDDYCNTPRPAPGKQILDRIKNRSEAQGTGPTISEETRSLDPTQGEPVRKVHAEVETSRLRQLITDFGKKE